MRDMRNLKLVPPPPDDREMWKQVMNLAYGSRRDHLFVWLREVRRVVEEREKRRGAA